MGSFRTALGTCCCVTNGNFDWYQWDVVGQPGQNYLAMHTAVQPATSIQDWIDFTSWLCDIDNPEWKMDTDEIWEADYNGNANAGLFFTLVGMADLYEGVFYAYEWYSTADSRLEVNVGLANATTETKVWEITRSPGADDTLPSAPLGYISPTFNEALRTPEWKNRAEDFQFTALLLLEREPVTPWRTDVFTADYSPGDIVQGFFSSGGSETRYRGNGTMESVYCNSEETTTSRIVAFTLILNQLYYGTDQFNYPYYGEFDEIYYDSQLTYNQSDGEVVEAGSRMVQAWLALEYPGILIDYGDTFHPTFGNIPNYYDIWWGGEYSKYQSFVLACNNAEAITRAVLTSPRNYPYAFGIRPPKALFYDNEIASTHYPDDSTGPWPAWHVESFTESVDLIFGEFVFPEVPEDTPAYIPAGNTIYHQEITQNRLAFDGIGVTEDGDNIAFISTHIYPMAVWASIKYGDANDLNQWGCIFSSMERDITASTNGLAGEFEEINEEVTDERVNIHLRINSETDVRKFRCYREDDVYRIWDILAVPKIESAQSLPGRYFIWLEQTYTDPQPEDITDPDTAPTKDIIEIRRTKVGETISDVLWQTNVAVNRTAVVRKPHLRLCSDRYYYLSDFQAVWPASKGGDDGIYSHWVCSHEIEEVSGSPGVNQPKIFYPWVGPAEGFNPWWTTATWNTWDDSPFIDSIKFSDNNRIAPALAVRTA